jgi:glutamate N-acetyltransferase/amino-acid N-acetyltransferase
VTVPHAPAPSDPVSDSDPDTDAPQLLPDGTLLSVPGLAGAAVASGVKESGRPDLALLVADAPRTAVGVFTRNALPAAPVLECREALARAPEARAVVINSGNANAMTGAQGVEDARAMAERVRRRCGGPVLVLSTGVIGVPLPVDRVLAGIDAAAERLGPDAGPDIAEAILTTDTVEKTCAVRVALPAAAGAPAGTATVGGVAKGSGMIHPNMATMLAVVATDAPVTADALDAMLRRSVDRSFHEITVDGDTSTNDAVLLLAGGQDAPPIGADDPRAPALERAVTAVMEDLARRIVHDGEGLQRVLELHVTGARTDDEARRVADAVVRSALVKTALAGGDPNWGRILAAAANAGVPLEAERLRLRIAGVDVFADGGPLAVDRGVVEASMQREDVRADLDLGRGTARARRFTTDLTRDYVRINSEYTT